MPASSNVFDKILRDPNYRKISAAQSFSWFSKKVKELGGVTPEQLLADKKRTTYGAQGFIGNLYFFSYSPKHAATLPYYDRFPLIIPIDITESSILGLNLHYLDPRLRIALFSKLLDFASDERYDSRTKLKMTYMMLKGVSRYREFLPCIKRYLADHIQSKFVKIAAPEWEIALFLPVQRFEKKTASKVWADSVAKLQYQHHYKPHLQRPQRVA